jgi:hypothetical protein
VGTLRAKRVRDLEAQAFQKVFLQPFPVALIIPDAFALTADGQKYIQSRQLASGALRLLYKLPLRHFYLPAVRYFANYGK